MRDFSHSVGTLLYSYRKFKANPDTGFQVPWAWPHDTWDWPRFRKWFRECLHRKINRDDTRTGRKHTDQYQRDLAWDRDRVHDYLFRRIRNSGCSGLLRTPELRKRYPHINCQPAEAW